ncbi:cytochrome c oxidase, cbb3-type, subunit IV (plasmid) [Ruegeria pomeroyi DSS-3]|uniref:Cytochrome c oxidase, cbb3-type, subunit IV n=2 Tax=Ruegeria pomeroyi TaxID=89184 RepID=Q5LL41_RUEPO|nr:CcoQ/FixQ family Cbb3-type cytochrome c oxidase assembly chaperone [Ruegeria pomeroyi]AAV97322.1 cytochrome c oxidase, cbb3-type, subunit IV [Ruegeria pomeroyi DSS-3]NVK96793.1 CcoQ/FixQ family Cbb3-type cytochrome c oxidase assembly chaperone [Ruegeria pomeroyi]NVL00011.1 CcoQ/FixQ family Cbb3-type cytochrome c oxidase assembly chaperone [Ruegeria pomeroyi]HCE71357.1 CcoQ/FixQ family Cbb3-type cytochrome c oxidase assembly chaperone [Ruegeria sp.]
MTHDAVLVFSKTWGAIYLLVVFVAAVLWTYWPSRRGLYDEAAQSPLQKDEDRPCR